MTYRFLQVASLDNRHTPDDNPTTHNLKVDNICTERCPVPPHDKKTSVVHFLVEQCLT